jgi:hypothetical protein
MSMTRRAIGAGAALAGLGGLATVWLLATPAISQVESRAATANVAAGSNSGGLPATKVQLRWDPSTDTDVSGYLVSWGDVPGKYTQTQAVGPEVTSLDLNVSPRPQPYYIAVQTRNRAGQLSGFSNEFGLDLSSGRPRPLKMAGWRAKGSSSEAKVKTPKPKLTPEEKAQRRREKQERKRKAQEAAKLESTKAPKPPKP